METCCRGSNASKNRGISYLTTHHAQYSHGRCFDMAQLRKKKGRTQKPY